MKGFCEFVVDLLVYSFLQDVVVRFIAVKSDLYEFFELLKQLLIHLFEVV